MTYALGIDLGTTFTAAASWRHGRVEVASLGSRTAAVPSVVLVREDGTVLVGEAASRRGLTEPHRVAREFKRRFGDTIPILLGGSPHSAEALTAKLLRAVVDEVGQREGGPPERICLSHPANWGPYKRDLLARTVRLAGLDQPVTYTTEPEAAAGFYAHQQRVDPGGMVAVYDLGGGTFDAAVLRKTAAGFELIGQPEGIERLGGIDFDAAVFEHVRRVLGDALDGLDEDDPAVVAAVARLREECTAAKEALSSDTDTTIPVLLPAGSTEVRLTRAELETMVRPALHSTVDALRRALQTADVAADQLHSVVLVGGASRMPIVAQLIGAELGRPVAVDAHPKHAVAQGAALLAGGAPRPRAATDTVALPPPAAPVPGPAGRATTTPAATPAATAAPAAAPLPAVVRAPASAGRAAVPARGQPLAAPPPPELALVRDPARRRRWPVLVATAAALAVLASAGAYALATRADRDPTTPLGGRPAGAPATSAVAEPTSQPQPTSQPPAETGSPPAETVTVEVWFLQEGRLVAAGRTRPFTLATSRLALTELVAGPTPEELGAGLGTAIPADLTFDISITDGVAAVDLPASFYQEVTTIEREAGVARLRQAQVVYTLTQFPTVSSVEFRADGEPLGPPVTRAGYLDLTPP